MTHSFSIHSRSFDSSNSNWNSNQEYNELFLKGVQTHMNNELRIRGHVFLNEIYDALRMERTREGAVLGWAKPDGFVKFTTGPVQSDGSFLVDFNVDGNITVHLEWALDVDSPNVNDEVQTTRIRFVGDYQLLAEKDGGVWDGYDWAREIFEHAQYKGLIEEYSIMNSLPGAYGLQFVSFWFEAEIPCEKLVKAKKQGLKIARKIVGEDDIKIRWAGLA